MHYVDINARDVFLRDGESESVEMISQGMYRDMCCVCELYLLSSI